MVKGRLGSHLVSRCGRGNRSSDHKPPPDTSTTLTMVAMSKPALLGFVLSIAGSAVAIRNYGIRESTKDQRVRKLFVESGTNSKSKDKVAVDGLFLRRVWRLLKIMCPGVLTPEFGYAVLVAVMLLSRTYCDLWMIRASTAIESAIISRNAAAFTAGLSKFVMGFLPMALVNNLLKYGLAEMVLRFRKRLTTYLYNQYMRGNTYYGISNTDNRIANPDQLLTQDVDRFANSVVELYSNLSKPLLDIGVYAYKLSHTIGMQGPGTMLGYLAMAGVVLTWLRRPIGRFTVCEQQIEGEYRFVNSRLITHSEEVAFYQGAKRERWILSHTFGRLIDHMRRSQQFRYIMGIVDTLVAKYFATVVGFWVISRPAFDNTTGGAMRTGRMEDYYESARMLINLSGAVGRLVLAGREMTRLAAFTSRVTELITVLDDLNNGYYERTMVGEGAEAKDKSAAAALEDAPEDKKSLARRESMAARSRIRHRMMCGVVRTEDNVIRFIDVPLATPNGDILVEKLNLEVPSGMNVLICGPNGCGKSSLFRILGGLWPMFGGELVKPPTDKLFYIPQRPYLTLGTLRDQVIYPHTVEDMRSAGYTDADLLALLQDVHLGQLVDRPGGWDAVNDWADVLSGGEKQRVAMARVFYHRPQFAILDECTSAVSVDVEGFMYERCKELNITLFTVSHRRSLWKYHANVLQMDGRGAYQFRPITKDDLESGFGS